MCHLGWVSLENSLDWLLPAAGREAADEVIRCRPDMDTGDRQRVRTCDVGHRPSWMLVVHIRDSSCYVYRCLDLLHTKLTWEIP